MMLHKLIVNSVIILILSNSNIFGQSAQDYYHNVLKNYIKDREQTCEEILDEGLKKYPNDPNLNAAKGLLKSQEQEEKNQDKKDQEQQEEEEKEEEQQEKQEQNPEQQASQKQKDSEQEKSQDLKQAESILDALKQDEKIMQKQQIARSKSRKLAKDW